MVPTSKFKIDLSAFLDERPPIECCSGLAEAHRLGTRLRQRRFRPRKNSSLRSQANGYGPRRKIVESSTAS
jgi:hypothetical protein